MQVKLEADNITIAAATMRILRLSLAECQERTLDKAFFCDIITPGIGAYGPTGQFSAQKE